VRVLWKTRIQI